MKYSFLITLLILFSCGQIVKVKNSDDHKKEIIYNDFSAEPIDTLNINNRLIGYWFFDSIYTNKRFYDARSEYKSIGFSFQRDRNLVEFELMSKGKKETILGSYILEGDKITSIELNGPIKEYKIDRLTDTSMVLIQNYNGNNFIFVCKKDLSEVLLDEKIYGKKNKMDSSSF